MPFNPESGLSLTRSLIPNAIHPSLDFGKGLDSVVHAIDLTDLDGSAGGMIYEFGGSGKGAYAGFRGNGDFVVRSGSGTVTWHANTAYMLLPGGSATVTGTGTLVVEYRRTPVTQVRVWWNGVELGSPVAGAISEFIAGNNDGGIFVLGGADVAWGEVSSAVAHTTASSLRVYENALVTEPSGVSGTASGSLDFSIAATGASQVAASAVGSLPISGSASAALRVAGQLSGALGLSGAASAAVRVAGQLSGALGFSGAAAAAARVSGQLAGSLDLSGSSGGSVRVSGQASGVLPITGSGASSSESGAVGSGVLPLTGSASAAVRVAGQVGAALPISGAATAAARVAGRVAGSLSLSGAASAAAAVRAQISAAFSLAGSAAAIVFTPGAVVSRVFLSGMPATPATLAGSPAQPVSLTGGDVMTDWQIRGFAKGEAVTIELSAKEPGGAAPLADPATQEITVTISRDGASEPVFVSGASHVSLVSSPESKFQIVLTAADLNDIAEGRVYQFSIWSKAPGKDLVRQGRGVLVLAASDAPAAWG